MNLTQRKQQEAYSLVVVVVETNVIDCCQYLAAESRSKQPVFYPQEHLLWR